MGKERITKTRAKYSNLADYFKQNKEEIHFSREQLTKITAGYISDDVNYLKRKNAPLAKGADENGYYIDKVEKIVIYFKQKK